MASPYSNPYEPDPLRPKVVARVKQDLGGPTSPIAPPTIPGAAPAPTSGGYRVGETQPTTPVPTPPPVAPMPPVSSPTPPAGGTPPRVTIPGGPETRPQIGPVGNPYRGTEDAWIGWLRSGGGGATASNRDGFFRSSKSVADLVNDFNAATGGHATFVGGPSGDKVDFGDGRGPVDVHTAQGELWYDEGQYGGGGAAAGGGGGASGDAGSGGAGPSGFTSQIRDIILNRLGGLQKFDPNSPIINDQMTAQERILERVRQDRRASDAERNAFNGLNSGGAGSGAFESEIAAGYEDKGQQLTGLRAQLVAREYDQQRQELQNLLQMAVASGDAESARDIQMKMAMLDATIRREGYGVQLAIDTANRNQNTVTNAG